MKMEDDSSMKMEDDDEGHEEEGKSHNKFDHQQSVRLDKDVACASYGMPTVSNQLQEVQNRQLIKLRQAQEKQRQKIQELHDKSKSNLLKEQERQQQQQRKHQQQQPSRQQQKEYLDCQQQLQHQHQKQIEELEKTQYQEKQELRDEHNEQQQELKQQHQQQLQQGVRLDKDVACASYGMPTVSNQLQEVQNRQLIKLRQAQEKQRQKIQELHDKSKSNLLKEQERQQQQQRKHQQQQPSRQQQKEYLDCQQQLQHQHQKQIEELEKTQYQEKQELRDEHNEQQQELKQQHQQQLQDYARPGGGDLPVHAGPPWDMYQTQGHGNSENVCMSVREAQPWRSDPGAIDPATQDENMLQIVNQMRNITISGQLTPQQMVSQYRQILAPMTQMDPQVQMQGNQPTAQRPRPASLEPERDAMPSTLPEYRMDRRPRGWCVIINNRDFTVQRGDADAKEMPKRTGTDKDAESLQHVFEKLGFIVNRRNNQSDSEMKHFLVDIAHNVDHSLFDCLVVCILTHGIENYVYGSNGRYVSIKDITGTFQANRCPNLAGKPKLFFIQACQGINKMEGNEVDRDAGDIEKDAVPHGLNRPRHQISIETDEVQKEMIPNEADFLIGYATVPGFVSFRSRNKGSWYIRKLCQLLDKFSDRHDLLSILVEVNREVSHANAQIDGGIFKQTPAPLVTLRKKLYFR